MATEQESVSFDQALARLEQIVTRLEVGEDGLEESIKLFEEAMALAERCEATLLGAEGRIKQLVERGPGAVAEEEMDQNA